MGRIHRDIVIDTPVETVYHYLSDPRNAPTYISSIKRIVSGPDPPAQVGEKWVAEADFMGGRHMLTLRLEELTPNAEVQLAMEGSMNAQVVIMLTPSPRNTRTAVALYLEVDSVPTLLLNAMLGGLLSEDMARLKRVLES